MSITVSKNDISSIQFSENFNTISVGAFQNCENLKEVKLWSNQLTSVMMSSFCNCRNLYDVDSRYVKHVETAAFLNCEKLSSFDVKEGDGAIIGTSAFANTSLQSIKIPDQANGVMSYAFTGSNLQSVDFGTQLTCIRDNCFEDCRLSDVQIPSTVKGISKYAFNNNYLTSIQFGDSVPSNSWISSYAFDGAQESSLVLPQGMKTIYARSFIRNEKLQRLALPASIASLGESSFGICPDLNEIYAIDKSSSNLLAILKNNSNTGALYMVNGDETYPTSADQKTIICHCSDGVFDCTTKTDLQNLSAEYQMSPHKTDRLYFQAGSQGGSISLQYGGGELPKPFAYSSDGVTGWTRYVGNIIELQPNEKVYLRYDGDDILSSLNSSATASECYGFVTDGEISAFGNIQYLLDKNGDSVEVGEYCFYRLFKSCSSLVTPPELPATTLAKRCYQEMFYGCSSLKYCPDLPAETLATYCYYRMFYKCLAMITPCAELPATTGLGTVCYKEMFNGCSSLMACPELPAINMTTDCYQGMFIGCSSLSACPELPATQVRTGCYQKMFSGCTGITVTPELPLSSTIGSGDYTCCTNMFENCDSNLHVKFTNLTREEYDTKIGRIGNIGIPDERLEFKDL